METSEPTTPVLKPAAELDRSRDRRGIVLLFLSGILVVLVAAASWAPDSRMSELRWLPGWIARLADRDPNIRTAVPFIPLAFLLMRGFTSCGLKWPVVGSLLVCGICLGLTELGQVILPAWTADVADLMWGGAGILFGVLAAWGSTNAQLVVHMARIMTIDMIISHDRVAL